MPLREQGDPSYNGDVTLSAEQIATLAPRAFENQRATRYRADEQAIPAAALIAEELDTVLGLYGVLGEIEEAACREEQRQGEGAESLQACLARHDLDRLLGRIRRLGATSGGDARLASAIHDIRGGALTTLFVHLAWFARAPQRLDTRRALCVAARDHRKMMRNVLLDLDPEARARDLAYVPHSLDELARALREFSGRIHDEPVAVDVDVDTGGDAPVVIAESCVECAAIDRVAYNLLNNAVRHADRSPISVWLQTLEHDLRVTVANAIAPEQRSALEVTLAERPAALYGSFTTTGSGHGLGIVADLVGRAYGLTATASLVEGGYVGARVVEDTFVTWFHWPLAGA